MTATLLVFSLAASYTAVSDFQVLTVERFEYYSEVTSSSSCSLVFQAAAAVGTRGAACVRALACMSWYI